jgi:hypothetical protein
MNDARAFVTWIERDYEPSVRVAAGAGHYARQPGVPEIDLYGVSDMACVLFTIGRMHPDNAERAGWADAFARLQDDAGYYVEAVPTHDRLHSTAFAVAAMELVGLQPARPLAFLDDYAEPESAEAFLDTLDWRDDVYLGSHRGAGLASLFALDSNRNAGAWFDRWFAALERRFDPRNGMLGEDKPASGDIDQIGGTFHYHFLYEWHHRRMPYADARVDAVLALQQVNGVWSDDSLLWVTLDAVYLLTRTSEHTGYRLNDVAGAVRRAVAAVEERVLSEDRRDEHFGWYLGAHALTAAVSLLAEAQRFLGADEIVTPRPLRPILDRRPFI